MVLQEEGNVADKIEAIWRDAGVLLVHADRSGDVLGFEGYSD